MTGTRHGSGRSEFSLPAQPGPAPLFIIGAAHSGTTILHRMLAYHPGLTWLSQFSLRGGEIPGRRRIPGANRLDALLRRVPHEWLKEPSTLRATLVPHPSETRTIWDFLFADRAAAAERTRACLAAFSARFGDRPVLAKFPHFHLFLGELREAFPQATFISTIRDGRAVALSLRPKFERRLDTDAALLAAGHHWRQVIEDADRDIGGGLLEIRYEDLCEDVHGTLRTVLDRAQLDVQSFPFDRCPETLENRNHRWLEVASRGELAAVTRIQREYLDRHNYPLEAPGVN